jgi:hypothetical protein
LEELSAIQLPFRNSRDAASRPSWGFRLSWSLLEHGPVPGIQTPSYQIELIASNPNYVRQGDPLLLRVALISSTSTDFDRHAAALVAAIRRDNDFQVEPAPPLSLEERAVRYKVTGVPTASYIREQMDYYKHSLPSNMAVGDVIIWQQSGYIVATAAFSPSAPDAEPFAQAQQQKLRDASQDLRIVAIDPADGATAINPDSDFHLTFNMPVASPSAISIEFEPPAIGCSTALESTQPTTALLVGSPLVLKPQTRYTATVYYSGRAVHKFTFTTGNSNKDWLPTHMRTKTLECGELQTLRKFPLSGVTPYRSDNVYADYEAPKQLRLMVRRGSVDSAIAELKQWMQQHGINPDTHKFRVAGGD